MINSLRKEIRYGLRNNTFLILFAVFFFFAFMTPVMLKILPEVLKSKFPGFPLQELVNMTQLGCLQSYMGDVWKSALCLSLLHSAAFWHRKSGITR